VQVQSQLSVVYQDHAEIIIICCSSILFLGGKEPSTLKSISESLGKETIDTCCESDTRLPFLDYFNKESRLYQVMTTKPGEI
jgi:type IV secretion system protein VirD4